MRRRNRGRKKKPNPAPILIAVMILCLLSLLVPMLSNADTWSDLDDGFDAGARHARYWEAGWSAFYLGTGAWSLYDAHTTDNPDDRYDGHVDAGKSLLGLIGVALYAPHHRQARQRFQALQTNGNADALDQARDLMTSLAASEEQHRRWQARLGGLIVNGLAGLAIGVEDNRPKDGWVNFATGMLTTEINIRTRPWEASQYQPRSPNLTLRADGGTLALYTDVWLSPMGAGAVVRF